MLAVSRTNRITSIFLLFHFFCNFLGCICFFLKLRSIFFFLIINLFITFNQIYKTSSKIKHKKHKTIYKLYTRLYLVIYFSLTYKFARYHRWNRQKQRCSIKKTLPKIPQNSQEQTPTPESPLQQSRRPEARNFIKK